MAKLVEATFLPAGGGALGCCSYEDPFSTERVGFRLLATACCCPATILASNATLIADEAPLAAPAGVLCSGGVTIGEYGVDTWRATCRSQLACGLLCMGFPIMCTEAIIQRQHIRDKYGLWRSGPLKEALAGCCYPCSLYDTHAFLRERQFQLTLARHHSNVEGECGPLETALRAMQRPQTSSRSVHAAAGSAFEATSPLVPPEDADGVTEVSIPAAVLRKNTGASDCTSPIATQISVGASADALVVSFAAAAQALHDEAAEAGGELGPADSVEGGSSGGEGVVEGTVTLFGRERMQSRRLPQQEEPTTSGSSGVSHHTATSTCIPPPEVTDSPRVARPRASHSSLGASSASFHCAAAAGLADSASFSVPSALPLPVMVREPPTFAVPPALKPPDSMDSEVMAAWMQGPKLSHLSQSLQRPATAEVQTPPARHPSDAPKHITDSCMSGGSLFSIALDAPSPATCSRVAPPTARGGGERGTPGTAGRTAPGATPTPRAAEEDAHTERASASASASTAAGAAAAAASMSSSRMSALVNRALLHGSAGSGSSVTRASGDTAATLDPLGALRCSMATILEAEHDADVAAASLANSRASLHSEADARAVGAAAGAGGVRRGACSSSNSGSATRRGASGARESAADRRARPAAVVSLSLSEERGGGSVRGSAVSSKRAFGRNRAANSTGAASRRSSLSSGSGVTSPVAARASGPRRSQAAADDSGGGASADNFSHLPAAGATTRQPAAAAPSSYSGMVYGNDADDAVNLASIRPSFMDGPDMAQLKAALRAAGEEEAADDTLDCPTPGALGMPPAAATLFLAPLAAASSAAAGRYARAAPAAPPSAAASALQASQGAGAPAALQGEASVGEPAAAASVSLVAGRGRAARAGPAAGASMSRQSASALSNGDTNGGGYSSIAGSMTVSQHRHAYYTNWMAAQSVVSGGAQSLNSVSQPAPQDDDGDVSSAPRAL